MPNETLATVLEQILDALEDLGRPLKVLVKPHPGQDQIFLASCLKDRPYAELSYEYPLLLSDNADLVVTTWSTTIIDALAMETPAIEFYPENNYFRTVYPAGSYTRQLGVPCVDNGSDFRLALRQVLAADYILPDPHEVMGDVVNFDIFRM
jgi:hypothetical protein